MQLCREVLNNPENGQGLVIYPAFRYVENPKIKKILLSQKKGFAFRRYWSSDPYDNNTGHFRQFGVADRVIPLS